MATVAEVKELETITAKDDEGYVELRSFSLSLNGIEVHLSTIGASISKILVPNYASSPVKQVDDIVLGYKSPACMLESGNPPYFGVIVGRVANRIAKGKLAISGEDSYQLAINNGPNHLHGGIRGFSRCVWDAEIVPIPVSETTPATEGVKFSLRSNDGDQGYPGMVQVTATYSLVPTPSNEGAGLRLVMDAKLLDDKVTPFGMAQHSYFNLASHNEPNGVLNHKVMLPSESYTPVDENLIPTREVRSLDQEPCMDWRGGKLVKDALVQYGVDKAGLSREESLLNTTLSRCAPDTAKTGSNSPAPGEAYGFDHNYVVKRDNDSELSLAGVVEYEETKRRMTVWTDAPGVQLYSGNFLDGVSLDTAYCKDSSAYLQWQSLCLESQTFPDSILVEEDDFPDFAKGRCFIMRPGGPDYHHTVEYRFEPMPCESKLSRSVDALTKPEAAAQGSDSEGRSYKSIEDMWRSQGVMEGNSNVSWYQRAADYYEENCPSTIDGVLGGFASISDLDLEGSREFLASIQNERPALDWSAGAGCECGAGIGRVSKGLLLPLGIERCDLVESSARLLSAAPEYIGEPAANRCRYYCAGLQDWIPPKQNYTIIWIQWVLCYLTDADCVAFLKRCGEGLLPGGIICLKENSCEDEAFVLDNDDASVTRSVPYLLKLVDEAGLRVVFQQTQDNFPDEIFPVPMIALDVKPS